MGIVRLILKPIVGLILLILRLFGIGKYEEHQMPSLVLFLREPRPKDTFSVQAAVRKALGSESRIQEVDVPADQFDGIVAVYSIEYKNNILAIQSARIPYDLNLPEDWPGLKIRPYRETIQNHRAWIAVDLINPAPGMTYKEAFKMLGKLIAALSDTDCLALYTPGSGGEMFTLYGPNLNPLLCGEDPLEVFEVDNLPMVQVEADDTAMVAAKAEARQRWPEFVQAFVQRTPARQFAVKAEFKENDKSEFIWVESIDRIENGVVSGLLSNTPEIVTNVKQDQPIVVRIEDIDDWIVTEGTDIVMGGFTMAVLIERSGSTEPGD